ncbi:MAG: putative salt-induced outer membrane protein [Cellvibrionaceae bacterium]|jgi:putative salt-induced outer membrane protein
MQHPISKTSAALITLGALTLPFSLAHAEDWTGEGSAGIVIVSGNSDSETVNIGLVLSKKVDVWEHTFKFNANSSESDGDKSAESYLAAYIAKYNFDAKRFLWADLRYLDDKFDSFDGITTIGAGYGYRISDSDELKWNFSAGIGYRDTEIESRGEDISGVAFIGESDFTLKLSKTTEFIDVFRVEATADNSYFQNIAGISVAMSDVLSLKVTYDVRYNTDSAAGDTNTDSITAVSVVYKL